MKLKKRYWFEDTVVVPLIRLDGLDVYLEEGKEGTNADVILANMKEFEAGPVADDGRRFVVREIVMTDIRVYAEFGFAGEKKEKR